MCLFTGTRDCQSQHLNLLSVLAETVLLEEPPDHSSPCTARLQPARMSGQAPLTPGEKWRAWAAADMTARMMAAKLNKPVADQLTESVIKRVSGESSLEWQCGTVCHCISLRTACAVKYAGAAAACQRR